MESADIPRRQEDDRSWRLAREREPVIRALSLLPMLNRAAVLEAANRLGISRAWLFKLVNRYRADPITTSLLGRTTGYPKGRHRLRLDVEVVVVSEIDQFLLTRPEAKFAELTRRIKLACAERGLTPPAFQTIRSRMNEMKHDRIVAGRNGRKAAN